MQFKENKHECSYVIFYSFIIKSRLDYEVGIDFLF